MSVGDVLLVEAILSPPALNVVSMFPGSPPYYHPTILINSVNATLTAPGFQLLRDIYLIYFKPDAQGKPVEASESLDYTIADGTGGGKVLTIAQNLSYCSLLDTVLYFQVDFDDNAPAGVRIAARVSCTFHQLDS
jgi:hypothetical protein